MTLRWDTPSTNQLEFQAAPLTTIIDELVIASMSMLPDGTYQLSWSIGVRANRTLPEVEKFVLAIARAIIDYDLPPSGDEEGGRD